MKKLIIILMVLIPLLSSGQKRAEVLNKKGMERLFKIHVNDSICKATANRKFKKKEQKFKNISEVVEFIKPLVYENHMKSKRLKDSYEGHTYNGFWIIKSLSFKDEKSDVLVILDQKTGDILLSKIIYKDSEISSE